MRQGLNETTTFNQNTFDLKKTYNFGKVKLSIFCGEICFKNSKNGIKG